MAEEKTNKEQGVINMNSNVAQTGLNMDQSVNQIGQGSLTYALNAAVENFDANSVNYQNEPGNEFCVQFPSGFSLIGHHLIAEQNKHIFFLVNPDTGDSHIGYMDNNDCVYKIYVNAKCLNFNIKYPIHKIVHKITNCTTEIYWTDGINPRRYLDLNNIPYKLGNGSPLCDPQFTDEVDCNQLKLQPNFKIPLLSVTDVIEGGDLTAGTYQFAIQYSDASGNPFTSYYSITNPTPISDTILTTPNFDYKVGKSIVLNITDLDETGQFQYFNLAVIKTVNDIPSVELVGTYFIDALVQKITYTGQNVTQIRLTINDIFEKYPYYEIAQDLTVVQDILVWDNLTSIDRINYQQIASQIELQWQTYKLPANENYADEINATNLRGYLRDEVYAFEIVFLLKNGKQTDGFHIPGREMNYFEISAPSVPNTNPDFIGEGTIAPYWKIYNTAVDLGVATGDKIGNAIPHRYGDFAYWESEETYPCNIDLWGELANTPIRHHKFPDVLVSPIFESQIFTTSDKMAIQKESVYPIGVKVDVNKIQNLILSSTLTDEQKADIAGFKIVRGDRSTNKSIIGKGILRNVGSYTREEQTFFFPNYPYNELESDIFINSSNNAYSKEGSPWLVICTESGEYEYTDLDTGKIKKAPMKAGETYEFCSLTRPKYLSGGANIGPANYEVWTVSSCYCNKGARYHWFDPFSTTNGSGSDKNTWVVTGPFGIGCETIGGLVVEVGGNVRYEESCFALFCSCDKKYQTPPGRILQEKGKVDFNVGRISPLSCGLDTPLSPSGVSSQTANRMVFNSPETSFGNPFLGNVIKLENVIFGRGKAHFVQVKKNANYKLLSKQAQIDALNSSQNIANIGGFNAASMFAAYQSYLTIYVNGITRKNYAYSYNSIASYDYSSSIPNGLGIKQRTLDIAQYLIPGVLNVGDIKNINNYQRESSVYLKTNDDPIDVTISYKKYTICNNNPTSFPVKPENDFVFNYINIDNYQTRSVSIPPQSCKTILSVVVPLKASGNTNYTLQVVSSGSIFRPALPKPPLPYPNQTNTMINPVTGLPKVSDLSRMTISGANACSAPAAEKDISVVSYYGSLKNINVNQWGQIYSYSTIDTGFQKNVDYSTTSEAVVVFGGDTFISRFAFKTKLPFFIDNRVGAPDDSDIFYDEIGNVGYPKYWHSSRSITENYNLNSGQVLSNIISYKAHNFDCPSDTTQSFVENAPGTYRTFYDGYFYLFAYGVPSFYCESSYNTDLRQAFNNREGDFWPHVSTGIPDDWVQESFVSIANDNSYYYNRTYSKQNKENFFSHLPPDWEQKLCFTNYPFRAIYSDRQSENADNRVNNWLSYRATSYFDFPQNYGKLTSLDGIQNRAVLARFENKSLLYNTLLTVDTSNPQAAYLGNDTLFRSSPPIDFAETDLGYVGSQNKFLLKIPQGQITVDAKRGQIFLVSGNQATDLSAFGSGMNRFFTDHLAFEILRYFPDLEQVVNGERITIPGVNIDNHFNGIGLHGVYDSKYDRVIITKLDYVPTSDQVKYDYQTKDFYVEEVINNTHIRTIVYLSDKEYFCNKSWTLSFNLNTKTWVSFHSYLPNFYMGENNFFYSGVNGCCDGFDLSGFGVIATSSLAEVVDRTTSTTTTEPVTPPSPFYDCELSGTAYSIDCSLDGTAIITVPPSTTTTTTTCPILENLYLFGSGYTINSIDVVSTISLQSACNAGSYVNSPIEANCSFSFSYLEVYANSLSVGEYVFDAPCSLLATGWYFTNSFAGDGLIYHIVDGIIAEIAPCVCTVTETTTIPPNIPECCSNVYVSNGLVKFTNESGEYTLDIPGYISSTGIAMSTTKFWAINTQIDEWDITLSPFSATFNRNIAFPGGFTTSSGIVAINNTTLIAINNTPSPQKVVELNITTLTASLTNKIDLQADRVAIGNPLYTIDDKLILINQDTITSDYYLSQYDYSSATLEVDFNMGSFAATAIGYCECIIYVVDNLGRVAMVVSTYPGHELAIISPATGLSTTSFAQPSSCVVTSLSGNPLLTTTTSTTVQTYCHTVSIVGDGNFYWLNASGETQIFTNEGIQSITVCAQYSSFSADEGVTYTICSDYLPCTTEGDCPTTSTTSSTTTSI